MIKPVKYPWLLFVLGLLIAAGMIAALMLAEIEREQSAGASGPVTTSGTPAIGGPFALVDQTGAVRTQADFAGRFVLVFFGFTQCPDVCPTTLAEMSQVLDALGPQADQVTPIFVSIDPERDTPAVLAGYTTTFSPKIVGLTGSIEQVAAAAKAYRIYYKKVPQGDSYTMDHSAVSYLMGPDGRYRAHFGYGTPVADMVAQIRARLAAG